MYDALLACPTEVAVFISHVRETALSDRILAGGRMVQTHCCEPFNDECIEMLKSSESGSSPKLRQLAQRLKIVP